MISMPEIEKMLRKISPLLTDWNPTDEQYMLVDVEEIPILVDQFPAYQWKENKWECEEIAKAFMMDVRRQEAEDPTISHNRAIGVAYCSRIAGEDVQHTVNILIAESGVYLLDMQTKHFWRAEGGRDEIYFVEM
jgi:hypothetical protein